MAALPYYTYMHTRNDTGRPFYIGKGTARRAWDDRPSKRGAHWANVVKKHGHQVHILARWDTEQEALQHEVFLIDTMRHMGIEIVNKSDGGEGTSGYKWSEESRKKLSAIQRVNNLGSGNPMFGRSHSEEARLKQSEKKAGQYVGSKHPKSTITEEVAATIKRAQGLMTAKQAAEKFNVSFHVVRNIWAGKSWGHVNG